MLPPDSDGLHHGQRFTAARLRNPGKYTDKSMRQAHSKRSKMRERTAAQASIMGAADDAVKGLCVNSYGTIKSCRNLVTRVNFRPTFVSKSKMPLQMIYALLLDEQPEVLRTYDRTKVLGYLSGVVGRGVGPDDDDEPPHWSNVARFAQHTINLLSQINDMRGEVDPIEVLCQRYLEPLLSPEDAYSAIMQSIRLRPDGEFHVLTPLKIMKNLKTLVHRVKPPVKLWSYNEDSDHEIDTVLLRRGQLKIHPWDQVVDAVNRSYAQHENRNGGNQDGEDANDDRDDADDNDNVHHGVGRGVRGRRGRPAGRRGRPRGQGRGGVNSRRGRVRERSPRGVSPSNRGTRADDVSYLPTRGRSRSPSLSRRDSGVSLGSPREHTRRDRESPRATGEEYLPPPAHSSRHMPLLSE